MSAIILEGHDAAQELLEQAATLSRSILAAWHRSPRLALVTMGAGASANAYIRRIQAFAALGGVEIILHETPATATPSQLMSDIAALAQDDGVDGILPLAPFPSHVAFASVAAALPPTKDVDGLTAFSAGQLARGLEGLLPCTPQAAIRLAERELGPLTGLTATVVGASSHVGRPLAELLLQRGATVTIAHVETRDLVAACRSAELLFVAVGKAGLITDAHVAPGATVIDIGINAVDDGQGGTRIVGDVDLATVRAVARALSAVPNGVGPLTTACLIHNCASAATRRFRDDAGRGGAYPNSTTPAPAGMTDVQERY